MAQAHRPSLRPSRTLIYIPVIHTEIDMGSLAEPLKKATIDRCGQARWHEHIKAVQDMWHGIQRKLHALHLAPHRVRLYQDGLPLCGRELEIVKEVAAMGSFNYQILLEWIEKGAQLEGTEDPKLLIEEYEMTKRIIELEKMTHSQTTDSQMKAYSKKLLGRRDRFIAQRILKTLEPGQTGLLFCGLEHRVDQHLKAHPIQIKYLFYRLPFRKIKMVH